MKIKDMMLCVRLTKEDVGRLEKFMKVFNCENKSACVRRLLEYFDEALGLADQLLVIEKMREISDSLKEKDKDDSEGC